MRGAYKSLVGKPKWKRSSGKPVNREGDNIET
jgi:hypothetical protein